MGKKKRKIKRFANRLERESDLFGFEFDDYIIGKNYIKSEGYLDRLNDIELLINFDNKGRADEIILSIDYYEVNATETQQWEFSNYKRFENAIDSRYEGDYDKAMSYVLKGTDSGVQRGVDLLEKIPGLDDLTISARNYDTYESFRWT